MGKRQRRRLRLVAESATAIANRTTITEARNTAPTALTGGRQLIQLIDPGWGSSGYYGAPVLAAAAEAKVFKAGMHMYLDHPTATEDYERPERSVKDLAAVLAEDAHVGEGGALVAEAKVFGPYQTVLAEMKEDIGLSIRAYAEAVDGEAEGRKGPIITRLVEGVSVDYVTHAGRGGKILSVLESARPTAREAHGMTANDLRDALRAVVRDTHATADNTWAWVRDYTDDWVVFELSTSDKEALYQQTYAADAGQITLTGDPVEVYAHTTFVPVGTLPPPATASVLPTESVTVALRQTDAATSVEHGKAIVEAVKATLESHTKPGGPPPDVTPATEGALMGKEQAGNEPADTGGTQASESRPTTPVSEAQRLQSLLDERNVQVGEALQRATVAEKRATEAERRATLIEARYEAEKRTKAKLTTSPLKEAAWPSVIAAVCDSVSLDENGKVDETKLDAAIEAEIERKRTEVASLLEAHGVGVPRDLGGGKTSESDVPDVDLAKEFEAFGMSESMAKLAAGAAVKGA